ncbi:MAG: HD domain-containing protein [Bacteroidetes bacterium]|nr:HD domain-containing protein [Bacteroidota bacterium]MBU1373695.1 HD domain-containing protein [Bacteroidota bacterium]MBU1485179.1 HD domain-containing protein [Bacteroidota bacterium]MBU1760181.1 HD domain-containing protein [Bacteroidota bacterium]MBU2269381.1 HD domain-containing protein [Bacteroidota bacterium]
MKSSHQIEDISNYVFNLFKVELPENLVYHNFIHTEQTVKAVEEISLEYDLKDEDKEDLIIAAWFHDTGYINNHVTHEEESVKIARKYLAKTLTESRLKHIERLILSTKFGGEHHDLSEEILHDADFINIGKKKFTQRAELLRCEWEKINDKTYSDLEWAQLQLDFLIGKKFKTTAAVSTYGPSREKNIKKLRQSIEKLKSDQYKLQLKEDGVKAKTNKEGRGIETLYRSVYGYHMNLSSMADQKANIMISINTIVVSVIITLFGSGYTFAEIGTFQHVRFVFPMAFLVISSLVSVTFAIISARPNITTKQKFELDNKNSSILFFGNFAQLQLKEFVDHIRVLKDQKEELYDSMTVDIYHLGSVLVRKYKLLKWSYNIFMIGLIVCAISFLVIMVLSY